MTDIEQRVIRYIADEMGRAPREHLDPETPLIEREILDSLAIMRLVEFLEDEMGIEVEDEDIVFENFATPADVARMVEAKRSAAA